MQVRRGGRPVYTPACTGAAVAWPSGKETLFWLWPPGHAWGQRGREWTGQTKCDCTGRHREQETVVRRGAAAKGRTLWGEAGHAGLALHSAKGWGAGAWTDHHGTRGKKALLD